MILKFNVIEQTITNQSNDKNPVADSKNYLHAEFTFSEEWEGKTKAAIFETPRGEPYSQLLTDNACIVPWEVIKAPFFTVSVFGGDLITANKVVVEVGQSGYKEGQVPKPPTPSLWEQLLEVIKKQFISVGVGETVTAKPGELAKVENVGTEKELILKFSIPKGEKGDAFTYSDFTEEQKKEMLLLALPDIEAVNKSVETIALSEENAKASADNAATSESNAKASETAAAESKAATEELTSRAETAADKAEESEGNAAASQKSAEQALADLLRMINSGDIVLAVNGKLPLSAIPATATQEIYTVTSEDELTSLTAQRGDLAELIEEIDGEQTITKTWQCLGDASVRDNWVVWGTSYAVQAGNATTADNASNANMINNHRIVEMTEEEFSAAVKDEDTYYLVY